MVSKHTGLADGLIVLGAKRGLTMSPGDQPFRTRPLPSRPTKTPSRQQALPNWLTLAFTESSLVVAQCCGLIGT
jgi:hypothetical protein